jgi:hypothetical protein
MTARLDILENSLKKKNGLFDDKLQAHFDSVAEANGQPLNDKRNGQRTLNKWEKQNDSLRALQSSIEKTQIAIEKEKEKIANVESFAVPECLKGFLQSGAIQQWRKYPRFFFVKGVEKARIVVTEDGTIACRYLKNIPNKEQYAIFRDVYNEAKLQESEI